MQNKEMASEPSTNKVPEFFHVFLPKFCTPQMQIASQFMTDYLQNLPQASNATIQRRGTGVEWMVDLVKEGGEFFFKGGWSKFVRDNDLERGEFMVFKYHDDAKFSVDIFGINGCLRGNLLLREDNVSANDIPKSTGKIPEKEAVVKEAKRYMKQSNNPCFMTLMTGSYVSHGSMNLPREFVAAYMKIEEIDTVTLEVEGKTWEVKLRGHVVKTSGSEVYHKFGSGIRPFIQENGVKRGDVCVFEALKVPCERFRATIIRSKK